MHSQLAINKVGNGYLRQLLVECANHVIGTHGKDSALEDGSSAWVPVAEAMHEDGPWWPSPGNLPFCLTESGSHRRSTCRSQSLRLIDEMESIQKHRIASIAIVSTNRSLPAGNAKRNERQSSPLAPCAHLDRA